MSHVLSSHAEQLAIMQIAQGACLKFKVASSGLESGCYLLEVQCNGPSNKYIYTNLLPNYLHM